MNNPNPLVPQGSIKAGKSTFRNAVLMIVVIHVAFIGGFLLWGCKDNNKDAAKKGDGSSNLTNDADLGSNTLSAPGASSSNSLGASNATSGTIPPLGSGPAPSVGLSTHRALRQQLHRPV